jgi:hypothetical protein
MPDPRYNLRLVDANDTILSYPGETVLGRFGDQLLVLAPSSVDVPMPPAGHQPTVNRELELLRAQVRQLQEQVASDDGRLARIEAFLGQLRHGGKSVYEPAITPASHGRTTGTPVEGIDYPRYPIGGREHAP